MRKQSSSDTQNSGSQERSGSKVKDLMTSNPEMIAPEATLQEAAQKMKDIDCGVLPVGSDSELAGIITDRDIVIRAIAEGKNPAEERVRDYMTNDVICCNEEDTLEQAADQMCEYQVNRLVVQNDEGTVCGILTFGRIVRQDDDVQEVGEVIQHATGKKAA